MCLDPSTSAPGPLSRASAAKKTKPTIPAQPQSWTWGDLFTCTYGRNSCEGATVLPWWAMRFVFTFEPEVTCWCQDSEQGAWTHSHWDLPVKPTLKICSITELCYQHTAGYSKGASAVFILASGSHEALNAKHLVCTFVCSSASQNRSKYFNETCWTLLLFLSFLKLIVLDVLHAGSKTGREVWSQT